ncbi:MAG: hypothetical protein ACI8QZ_001413 [Chlamydiales bacterium]|jgi:hypothetical protein
MISLTYCLLLAQISAAGAGQTAFVQTVVRAPQKDVSFVLRDFSGEGRMDLLRIESDGLFLTRMGADGTFAAQPVHLAWPGDRVGWDVADMDGDGQHEIVMLVDGSLVRVHHIDDSGAIGDGADVFEVQSSLPVGVHRIHFVRDVDGDGRPDLVMPGAGVHRIYLAGKEGWGVPIEVKYEAELGIDVGDPESLSSFFGQEVRIPWFKLKDVDGDGRRDLISETRERIAFHLAQPTLSSEPTWILDLEALRAQLPDSEEIDFQNLLSAVENRVSWRFADLDGKGARDLLIVLGPKFRVYLDGALTGPVGVPDQVLKSSGNVLWSTLRQVAGDGRADLQILRGERISIGRVLRTLILPGALNFDVYTYENQAGVFTRKPTRRNRITLKIPRLLSFINDAEGMGDALEAQFRIPAQRMPHIPGQPAQGDDIVDVLDADVAIFPGRAPAPLFVENLVGAVSDEDEVERLLVGLVLEELDGKGDGASRTFDFGKLPEEDLALGAILRSARGDAQPSARHALIADPENVTRLLVRDLDGDGLSDVVVVSLLEGQWTLQFLVRR